jgi:Uma2 family endonuclease
MPATAIARPEKVQTEPPRMTFEEFLEWANEDTFAEWVDGRVIFMTTDAMHQQISAFLFKILIHFVEERDLGDVWGPPFVMRAQRGGPGREPDLLYFSKQTLERVRGNWLEGPADLVVEVVSSESRKRDRIEKFREYAESGVREYWIIDPAREQAEFFGLEDGGHYVPLPSDEFGRVYSKVLPDLWIDTGWLARRPLPKLSEIISAWQDAAKLASPTSSSSKSKRKAK